MNDAEKSMLVAAADGFLRGHLPFGAMSATATRQIAASLKLTYFAKGSTALDPAAGTPSSLFIVQRGRIESRRASLSGPESIRSLGPGEMFPISALLAQRASRNTYRAVEDSFCYLLPHTDFIRCFEDNAVFRRFCTDHLGSLLEQTERDCQGEFAQVVALQQTLNAPLREVMTRDALTCGPDTSIGDVLRQMTQRKVGSMLITQEQRPIGILTERDVISRITLARAELNAPIADVMTREPVTLRADQTGYEAALAMTRHGIRHIPVQDDERLVGIVSERDLFGLQRSGLHHIGRAISAAANPEGLQAAAGGIRRLIERMLAQGVAGEQLTRLISSLNDRVAQRAIALAAEQHPIGDVAYCWLALGSEGRHEQTLASDQDNAIVFETTEAAKAEDQRQRLLAFARTVNETLDRCGFPLCKGGIMASNPAWCLTRSEWLTHFVDWVHSPTPQALLNAAIFFDLRPLAGTYHLGTELRAAVTELAASRTLFLRQMAVNALESAPPLGLLRDFVTDDKDHPGTIDLKAGGIRIFVDAARIMALAQRVTETCSADRLRLAGRAQRMPDAEIAALVDAFYYLQVLRLKHQQLHPSEAPNRIAPAALNDLERRVLKEALRLAKSLQTRLALDYQL